MRSCWQSCIHTISGQSRVFSLVCVVDLSSVKAVHIVLKINVLGARKTCFLLLLLIGLIDFLINHLSLIEILDFHSG